MKAICFVGWSGSGKTTLIERLLPLLRRPGRVVGYLKSGHKGFDMDRPGKDTDRIFRSGADKVAIVSPSEGALRFRLRERDADQLMRDHFADCDLVVLEGFKGADLPKIEVAHGDAVLDAGDPTLLAVVGDEPDPRDVPRFPRADTAGLVRFVEKRLLG